MEACGLIKANGWYGFFSHMSSPAVWHLEGFSGCSRGAPPGWLDRESSERQRVQP
jgi:hypothetical protein